MLAPGSLLAGYRIDRVLGRGGMGVVYEATQLSLGRVVALKVVAPDLSGDPAFEKRFRREGRLQSQINHPHIVPVHEAGRADEGLFLAMMLIRGPTLKDLIVARELDAPRALRLLSPIADAIDAAHAEGMVHRDLKPQNILVGRRDHAYLSDFGLTQGAGDSSLTATGAFVGTYDYVSPEQISAERATPLSDVYSFAAVLYEALTGIVPYAKPSKAAVLFAHVADPPPRVTDQRPELPEALDRVIARGMAKKPADRFGSASELMADAERAFDRAVRAITRPPGPVESPEEIGVRQAEQNISTAETRAMGPPAAGVAASVRATSSELSAVVTHPPRAPVGVQRFHNRPRTVVVAVIAILALAAAALGAMLGGDDNQSASSPAKPAVIASAGNVSVPVPDGWQEVQAKPPSALRLDPVVTLRSTSAEGGTVFVGQTAATGKELLPESFRKSLSNLPVGDYVQLDHFEALRYADVPTNGAGVRRLYVVPNAAGAATVACVATIARPASLLQSCDSVANGLVLRGIHAFPVTADSAYATTLGETVNKLRKMRLPAVTLLRKSSSPAADAAASGRLAAAYGTAAETLRDRRIAVPPQVKPAHERLLKSLDSAAKGFDAMSRAARRHEAGVYRRATGRASRAEGAFRAAVDSLRDLGYRAR